MHPLEAALLAVIIALACCLIAIETSATCTTFDDGQQIWIAESRACR
jgi:hypothetical protein